MKKQKIEKVSFAFIVVALLAVAGAVVVFFQVIEKPLLGPHAFRQTQNALSSYYFAKELLPIWVNKMPVLGPPWNVPTELPLFQYLSARLHLLSDLPLDLAGRVVSIFFMISMLFPLAIIARICAEKRNAAWLAVAVTVSSPLYLFWAPSYMMETTALFLSLMMVCISLLLVTSLMRSGLFVNKSLHAFLFLIACSIGVVGAMQKGTTWASAAGVLLLLVIYFGVKFRCGRIRFLVAFTLVMIVISSSLICAKTWLNYGDSVKKLNPIAKEMVVVGSAHHNKWNYGTLEQKLSLQTWIIIWNHIKDQIAVPLPVLNWSFLLFIIVLGAVCAPSSVWLTSIFIAGFLSGPLIFTNLYMEHSYYWCANAVWLLLAIVVSLVSIDHFILNKLNFGYTSLILCIVIVVSGFLTWQSRFLPIWRQIPTYTELNQAWIQPVQRMVPESRSLFILWPNWNPMMHYYAERKGLAFPLSDGLQIPGPQFDASLDLMDFDEKVGAILIANEFITETNNNFIQWLLDKLNVSKSGQVTPFGVLFQAEDLSSDKK